MTNIEYADIRCPEAAETLAVNDGIRWLRMPLPFSLDHINLWLLRDSGGWVVVDTGINSAKTRDVWQRTFEDVMRGEPATHVIATHLHPDHSGCAGWLTAEFDVDLWMTNLEYTLCRHLIAESDTPAPESNVAFYRSAGFEEKQLEQYRDNFGMFGRMVGALPASYRCMRDGERLEFAGYHWQVVTGGGHSPEHACLFDDERNILIAGDMLLPSISPNISVWPTNAAGNPLHDWFDGLRRLAARLPTDVLVLPAHGKPYRGAHARIAQLMRNHETRLDRLLSLCDTPHRVVDVFETLYNVPINDGNRIMATGEAIAHLHYLCRDGTMTVEADEAGVNWYRRA